MNILKIVLLLVGCFLSFIGATLAVNGALNLSKERQAAEAFIAVGSIILAVSHILLITCSFIRNKSELPAASPLDTQPQYIAPPPVLPEEKGYFVVVNGQRKGAFSISKIIKAYEAKEISRDALVWMEGMETWKPLIEVEDFRKWIPNAPNFPPLPPTA